MRIIDELTEAEVTSPDMALGYTYPSKRIMDHVWDELSADTKRSITELDYENVLVYHVYTADEIASRERQEAIEGLPEAVIALDEQHDVYATGTDSALFDLADYIAELEARIAALGA